jgi:membrane protease subunit HflK
MAWDDKSGNKGRNPWGTPPGGGGGRGPWGSNGGNGGGDGPNQSDFDDIFGKLQDNMRGMMPGNFGGGKIIIAGVSALALLWLASGFYIVNPGEHAVVQRFGAWNRTIDNEGLKYHVPAPIENVTSLNVNEIRTLNIGFTGPVTRGSTTAATRDVPDESLMLTSDFNIVDVDFVVQWNISSAEDFIFNIQNPENTLRKAAQSAMREVVGQTRMFNIITTERGAVGDNAKAILQRILNEYGAGINITQVLINSAQVHPDVQNAFQDVQAAKQDAEDVQNRAGAYREDIIPKARGQAKRIEQEASAYEQSVIARAKGDASRFNSVLEAYQTGKDVTKERMYIETMEEVLSNAQKIIMDDKAGKGVVPYLPLNELNRTAPAAGNNNNNNSSKGQ